MLSFFTGARVSAESGIPTFRDALTGLWERFDAYDLASMEGYLHDKAMVWGWYEWRRAKVLKAQPNPAHFAIAQMAECAEKLTLITQNVDDLHERAGSSNVIHLHGEITRAHCVECAAPYTFPPGIPDEPENGKRVDPPVCGRCGGTMRPGVVWFGEELPLKAYQQAVEAAREGDEFVTVGTSSLVYPAAELPYIAAENGKIVVQVNPVETSMDQISMHVLRGRAGDVMPALLHCWR